MEEIVQEFFNVVKSVRHGMNPAVRAAQEQRAIEIFQSCPGLIHEVYKGLPDAAIIEASCRKMDRLCRLMLEEGANPEAVNPKGFPLVHVAVVLDMPETFAFLRYEADLNSVNRQSCDQGIFHSLTHGSNPGKYIGQLALAGVPVDRPDSNGVTALQRGVTEKVSPSYIDELLLWGACPVRVYDDTTSRTRNYKKIWNPSAMELAFQKGNVDCITKFVINGATLDSPVYKKPPMMYLVDALDAVVDRDDPDMMRQTVATVTKVIEATIAVFAERRHVGEVEDAVSSTNDALLMGLYIRALRNQLPNTYKELEDRVPEIGKLSR